MYETYLFGRTHVGGETLTANIDTGSEWGLTVEEGFGTKLEVVPFTNNQLFQIFKGAAGANLPGVQMSGIGATNQGFGYQRNLSDRDAEYLPYAGPVPQGSTYLAHLHAGLAYKKMLTFGAHFLYVWSPDDNWDGTDVSTGMMGTGNSQAVNVSTGVPRYSRPTPGSMTVVGGDVRLNGGALGRRVSRLFAHRREKHQCALGRARGAALARRLAVQAEHVRHHVQPAHGRVCGSAKRVRQGRHDRISIRVQLRRARAVSRRRSGATVPT